MSRSGAPPVGVLVGVGVGPGDPELVTLAAVRALREADVVFAPTTAVDAVGRAEAIVRQACPDVRPERLVVTMDGRPGVYDGPAARIVAGLEAGRRVAFVTLGDPNVYSTFSALAAEVRRRLPAARLETVPGIMAFQALAATAGSALVKGRERLSMVTALDGPGDLEAALVDPTAAVVVYKGGRHLPAIAKRLAEAGRLGGAVVGELLGMPGQRVEPVADAASGPAAYLATVIVPPAGRSA